MTAAAGWKATAVAHPNIALVKYWGKRDEALILPHQSSLSVTLAPLSVTATVRFDAPREAIRINGREARGTERARVEALIDAVRMAAPGALGAVEVETRGDFPAAAGLASSAAAFASLAVAARAAAGLARDVRAESILARTGSGSACRSIQGGFVAWRRGTRADGQDSFAEQLHPAAHWPQLRLLAAIVSREEKKVGSRDGMRSTAATSPYYPAWVAQAEADVPAAAELVRRRDLRGLGELAERNAWRMHASALAADPPLCYLLPETLRIIHALADAREASGLEAWFTLDAGPNPVILTDAENEPRALQLLHRAGAAEVIPCHPGEDARLVGAPLF